MESKQFVNSSFRDNHHPAQTFKTMNQYTFKSYLKNFYTTNQMLFKNNKNTKSEQQNDEDHIVKNRSSDNNDKKPQEDQQYLNIGEFIRQKVKTIIENYQKSPRTRCQPAASINDNNLQNESDKFNSSLTHDASEIVSSDSTLFHGHDVSMVTLVSSELNVKKSIKPKDLPKKPQENSSGTSITKDTGARILNKDQKNKLNHRSKHIKRKKSQQSRSVVKDKESRLQQKYNLSSLKVKENVKKRKRAGGSYGRGIIDMGPVKNIFVNQKYSLDAGKKISLQENQSKHGRKQYTERDRKQSVEDRKLQSDLDEGQKDIIKAKEKWSTVVLKANKKESIEAILSDVSLKKCIRRKKIQFSTINPETALRYYGTMTPETVWTGSEKLRGCVVLDDEISCSGFLLLDSKEKKKMAKPLEYNIYFIVHRGQTAVNINGINYLPKILDHFYVPVGSKYSIKNLSHEQALFSYIKIKPPATSTT